MLRYCGYENTISLLIHIFWADTYQERDIAPPILYKLYISALAFMLINDACQKEDGKIKVRFKTSNEMHEAHIYVGITIKTLKYRNKIFRS